MKDLINFASDNHAPVHPKIMQALQDANYGQAKAYGHDEYTNQAIQKFKGLLGEQCEIFFVFLGTAANVLSLQAMTKSYEAIICANSAHIYVDEAGAPNRMAAQLLTVPNYNGKIKIADIEKYISWQGREHTVQPKVISITQSTEFGCVYTKDEIKLLADFAHQHRMYLHIDGARICNAAVALNCSFKEMLIDSGVDVISFGGTKNGMMYGEAIIFLNPGFSKNFSYLRKQGMQLASKMRYISCQFNELMTNNLWYENAKQANDMAKLLELKLREINISITRPVEVNAVFAVIPSHMVDKLQQTFSFYVWNKETGEARIMTSYNTSEQEINRFIEEIKSYE